jgi:hypothetical protein
MLHAAPGSLCSTSDAKLNITGRNVLACDSSGSTPAREAIFVV